MAATVASYLKANIALWTNRPAFVTAVGQLDGYIAAVNAKAGEQEDPIEGVTVDKGSAHEALEDLAFEIADTVAAYAAATPGKEALFSDTDFTRSALDRLPAAELVRTARVIHDRAEENLAALGTEVTQADLDDLDDAIKLFDQLKEQPRTAIAGRAGHTATLRELLRAEQAVLRTQLDKLMTKYARTDPTFYAGYRTARVIVDRPAGFGGDEPTPPASRLEPGKRNRGGLADAGERIPE